MSLSLTFACLWAILANVAAMLPSKDRHWTWAYWLIGIGIPILGFVTWQHGPWLGLLIMVAGMSLLRWPVIYLARWMKTRIMGAAPETCSTSR